MSVTNFLIPLINQSQTFEITLAGVDYLITSKWNPSSDAGWVLDIADSSGNTLACNLAFTTGHDILEGLEYLGIGGSLFVLTNGASPFDVPTLDNLGGESNLYFQTSIP